MTAGALAGGLQLSRSAVTTVIDRLEALRYVRRVPGQEDRRQILVELTPLLLRRARELYGDGEDVARVLDRYSAAELELICGFVRDDRKMNERRAELARPARAKRR